MKSTFDQGPEGWCSYEYHAGVRAGRSMFILTVWEPTGGVDDSGYIWSDEHGWSADTPEVPISVFPFVIRTHWVGLEPLDFRDANVSVYLRGDNLVTSGARCVFWIESGETSYHLNSHLLEISDGRWSDEPNRFVLADDESKWHRTWAKDPSRARGLSDALAETRRYAFQLVGFSSLPKGRISMDELQIDLATR